MTENVTDHMAGHPAEDPNDGRMLDWVVSRFVDEVPSAAHAVTFQNCRGMPTPRYTGSSSSSTGPVSTDSRSRYVLA